MMMRTIKRMVLAGIVAGAVGLGVWVNHAPNICAGPVCAHVAPTFTVQPQP